MLKSISKLSDFVVDSVEFSYRVGVSVECNNRVEDGVERSFECFNILELNFNSNDDNDKEIDNSEEVVEDLNKIIDQIKDEKSFKDIKHWIRRFLVKENNIKLIESHIKNGTTPSQLFFDKFPTPFLNYDSIFVENYNKIIQKAQIEILNESLIRLNCQIKDLKKNPNR
ncbi:unnamed protein product [Brachionus calyciflorus]|uniref:Uncharacterized protein n=1 Tax=Brachionus calyciflorus TaxID=104777 RepID=A0A813UN16_9BILA|nr:unnamed protein product [Brachionus calyciflorus]